MIYQRPNHLGGRNMKKRILIVDDEPNITFFLAESLAELGPDYEVATCNSAAEALALHTAQPFALVITDLLMPGITGLRLAQLLRAQQPALKLILMTAYGNEAVIRRAEQLGFNDYITKPFTVEEMLVTVQAILKNEANQGQGSIGSVPPFAPLSPDINEPAPEPVCLAREVQRLSVQSSLDMIIARTTVRKLADTLGYSFDGQVRLSMAISEIARHLLTFAGRGKIVISWREDSPECKGLEFFCYDDDSHGSWLNAVLQAGDNGTHNTLNLMSLKKLSDIFKLTEHPEYGSCVTIVKWIS